jgi:hypothetical protein
MEIENNQFFLSYEIFLKNEKDWNILKLKSCKKKPEIILTDKLQRIKDPLIIWLDNNWNYPICFKDGEK